MERRTFWLAGSVVVAASALAVVAHGHGKHKGGPHLQTVTVDRGRIVGRTTASGTLSALVTVQVGSQVSGRLQEIAVDFGSPVKKGDVIARIDPALFHAALRQARASCAAGV